MRFQKCESVSLTVFFILLCFRTFSGLGKYKYRISKCTRDIHQQGLVIFGWISFFFNFLFSMLFNFVLVWLSNYFNLSVTVETRVWRIEISLVHQICAQILVTSYKVWVAAVSLRILRELENVYPKGVLFCRPLYALLMFLSSPIDSSWYRTSDFTCFIYVM